MPDPRTDDELNEYRPIDHTHDPDEEAEIADRDADADQRRDAEARVIGGACDA